MKQRRGVTCVGTVSSLGPAVGQAFIVTGNHTAGDLNPCLKVTHLKYENEENETKKFACPFKKYETSNK